jgi:hypothetical protein
MLVLVAALDISFSFATQENLNLKEERAQVMSLIVTNTTWLT